MAAEWIAGVVVSDVVDDNVVAAVIKIDTIVHIVRHNMIVVNVNQEYAHRPCRARIPNDVSLEFPMASPGDIEAIGEDGTIGFERRKLHDGIGRILRNKANEEVADSTVAQDADVRRLRKDVDTIPKVTAALNCMVV